MPLAQNLLALAVVVLANVAELLVVIALCLTGAERFGHRHHARVPLCPRRANTYGTDRVGDRARHQRRVSLRERDEPYAECRDQVPQLQIAMQVGETADLAREDQRLNVAFERIAR